MKEKVEGKFEEKIKELDQITKQLEKGDLTLDESVAVFEKGMKLSKECNQILEEAEKRITILLKKEEGEVEEEEFTLKD